MKTANPTKTLLRKLDRTLTALVAEKVKEHDLEPAMEEAAVNYNFESHIEKAVENYDFDSAIDSAVQDFDFDEAISKHVDLDGDAEKALDKALDNKDIDATVDEAVEQAIADKLPAAVEKALFALLERPDVAERLVRVLFDKAAS